ncbi:putative ABC transporter [Aureobasidium sp. EXF-8845]|nr:putative ABC transporter [Aureobasidium sp. EXF-8845]KAI4857656.1 putative ABC transporter [Aureobasidium sp. EXF-8846]
MSNSTWLSDATMSCTSHAFGPANCDGSFDFTLLFEQSILSIAPSAIFLCCLPVSLFKLHQAAPRFNASYIRTLKLIIASLLVVTQILLLAFWAHRPALRTSATVPAICLGLLVSLAVTGLSSQSHMRSIRPSSLLSVYLLFSCLFDAVQVRTLFISHAGKIIPSLLSVSIALKLVLLTIECRNKRPWLRDGYQTLPPEATAGIMSRSILWWLNPLFLDGMRTLLSPDQLYALDPDLESRKTGQDLEATFAKQSMRSQKRSDSSTGESSIWSLPKACFQCLWISIAAMIPTRLALVAFTYGQTFLFTRAINYLSQEKDTNSTNTGYGLIAATFIIYLGIAVSTALYQQQISRIMTKLRGALISLIYNRILVISDGASRDGAALTLISSDIDIIIRVLGELNESWARLIEVAVGIGLLSRQVGAVCVVPIILTVISTQAQGWVSRRIGSRRKDWNSATQKRVNTTAAVLGSIQSVKMSGLMNPASELLHSLRLRELDMLASLSRFIIGLNAIAVIPSVWSPVLTFIVYAIKARIDGSADLDISQAFTSMALLNLVTTPTAKLLTIMPLWAQALGCFERLQQYFELPVHDRRSASSASNIDPQNTDIEMSALRSLRAQECAITCTNMDIGLSTGGPAILKNITFEMRSGSLTVVTGPTGSGKTTLLKALLGETHLLKGQMSIFSTSISYCNQIPWMTNTSIKEFITGPKNDARPTIESLYGLIVHACDLVKDIAGMPDGDDTTLGSKGVSLSGGQRARLALARAVYARKDIILLDDVFSALDTNTKEAIYSRLLGPHGLLRELGTTILLVTHWQKATAGADQILTLSQDGHIAYQGSPDVLLDTESYSVQSGSDGREAGANVVQSPKIQAPKGPSKEDKDDLARRTGDWSIYKFYFGNFQKRYLAMFVACSAGAAFSSRFSQILLKWWTADEGSNLGMYLSIYALLALAQTSFSNLNMWVVFLKMIPASAVNMHRTLLATIAGAASSVFYNTDSGAILNRFAQDMYLVIGALPTSLIATGNTLCETLASLAMISTGASYMGITIPFVMIAIFLVQKVYLNTSRQLRLLEIEARSPIYSHFLETLEGVVTIRAFGWEEDAKEIHLRLLDVAQSPYYLLSCIQRWLKLVLDLIVAALAVIVVALAVSQRGTTSAGLLGVALTNVLGFSQSLTRLVTEWTTLETSLGAISRVRSFAADTEQDALPEHAATSANLVNEGEVVFSGVYAKYTDEPGPYDLNDINFTVRPGTKVAICGRTGSGKSSLMNALFRLLPLRHGSIHVDGVDINNVDPDVVRRNIIAIPQQPFLLPGSIRLNLDPENQYSDAELNTALSKVRLLNLINERGGLDANIDQQTLSQGQSQLLCLARALLRKSRLVVLDEATSSLDSETDELIRAVLRLNFADCTVISIAHREATIIEADMVIVMDAGHVSAIGEPSQLIQRVNLSL